jgi:hypothetical protein
MAEYPDSADSLDYPIRIERSVFPSPDGEIVSEVARFDQKKMAIRI